MANINPQITNPDMRAMLGLPPLTGWSQRLMEAQGEGASGQNAWYNWDTGEWSKTDPNADPSRSSTYYGGSALERLKQMTVNTNGADSMNPMFATGMQQGLMPLDVFLEQALDPMARAQGIDLSPYMQGVNVNPAGISNQRSIDENLQAANTVLSRLYAANPQAFRGGQFAPWQNFGDWNTRQNQRAGFNESASIGDFLKQAPGDIVDVGQELWAEPGFRQLALTAAGGAYAGSQAAPAAGAGTAPSAAAGGTSGGSVGTGAATAGTQGAGYFGGLSPTGGTLGLSQGAAGAAGVSPAFATGNLAPGFFAAESLYPTVGGLTAASGAGTTAGTVAGTTGGAATSGGISGILSNPMTLGMLGGAALGGLSGSEQTGTMTVNEGLPDWLLPYAKPQLDKYSTDLQNYQIDPYGIMPSAMQEFQRTISGQYLDPSSNKYLEDYFKLGAERIKGSLSPSFGHMQAFGQHSGYNEALARGLGDFSTMLYGGAYEKERDRQNQLTASAPSFLAGSSTAAFTPYQQYLGTLSSLGKKKEQPLYENPWGDVLGGAMAGGSLGWMFGGGGKK